MGEIRLGMRVRHYKGGLYTVECVATDEETQESLIVYRSVETGACWVRPLDDFCGEVVTRAGDVVGRYEAVQ